MKKVTKKLFTELLESGQVIEVKTMKGLKNILKYNRSYYIVNYYKDYVIFTGSYYKEQMFTTNNKELLQELVKRYIKKRKRVNTSLSSSSIC